MDETNKYPQDISPLSTANNSLTATIMFCPLTAENIKSGAKPLDIHSGYSRVKLSILDFSDRDNKKAVSANIPAKRRLETLYRSTRDAVSLCRTNKWNKPVQSGGKEVNPAYTVKITSGDLKGQTPAQLMLDDAEGNRQKLKKQYLWLQNNIAKFPNNKVQMEAIAEAINLYDAGALSEEEAKNPDGCSSEFIVYEDAMKIPHADKKDEEGKTDVYNFKVVCDPSRNYPFKIEIMNGKAPVRKAQNGAIQADMQKASDVVKLSFNASADDFEAFVSDIWKRKELFEAMWYPTMQKKAEELAKQARVK